MFLASLAAVFQVASSVAEIVKGGQLCVKAARYCYGKIFNNPEEVLISNALSADIVEEAPSTPPMEGPLDFELEIRHKQEINQALASDLTALAMMTDEEIEEKAKAVVEEQLPDKSPEFKEEVTQFLKQVPERIRNNLKRPEDPSGTTVPMNWSVEQPEDLEGFIPPHFPRMKKGQQPPNNNKYVLLERKGIGGFGEVWIAKHTDIENRYSVFKFCLDPISQMRLFKHEPKVINQVMNELDHPNIVKLENVDFNREAPWLQYEYISGGELHRLLDNWPQDMEERARNAVAIVRLLADTIAECHELDPAVVHRDLKPSNVLIAPLKRKRTTGEPQNILEALNITLKITDFGISETLARRSMEDSRSTVSYMKQSATMILRHAHTPTYASPQQKEANDPHPADDVHALGVILYQLLMGSFDIALGVDMWDDLKEKHVCKALLHLLSRAVAYRQERRYQNCRELVDALDRLPEKLSEVHESPEQIVAREKQRREQWEIERKRLEAELHEKSQVEMARLEAERAALAKRAEETVNKLHRDRLNRSILEADEKNAEARSLFNQKNYAQAKKILDTIDHERLRDPRLYQLVSFYVEGKRFKNSIGMEFCWVPPGTSWLGGGGGTVGQNKFVLKEGLLCGTYLVTQGEWEAVMGNNPSHFKGSKRLPVESISWDKITKEFLPKLNAKCKADGYIYRLPTSEEWEYIARGGPITQEQSKFHYYFAKSKMDLTPNPTNELTSALANFDGSGLDKTTEVGSYLPNPLGIYDIVGNTWEWTETASGSVRVRRGGSYFLSAGNCVASYVPTYAPVSRYDLLGFRVLAVPLEE
ncbi:MAG: SUMF1/EgtB/PvdO family nonheme iron enzyme [Zavarzinella sp.]